MRFKQYVNLVSQFEDLKIWAWFINLHSRSYLSAV